MGPQVEREIALHSRLRHRNIVAFHAHFADRDHVYMVLEYCSRQVAGVGRGLFSGVGLATTGRGLCVWVAYFRGRGLLCWPWV